MDGVVAEVAAEIAGVSPVEEQEFLVARTTFRRVAAREVERARPL